MVKTKWKYHRKPKKGNFLKRVQKTKRVKSIKAKIRDNKRKAKILSRLYKTAIRIESKRLKT